MARAFQSESIRGNMAESLARRPQIAIGSVAASPLSQFEGRSKLAGACLIELDRIIPDPDQPRSEWDTDEAIQELERLAASLKSRGQLQPIRVRWIEEAGQYMVVVGERRWRAARMAGLTSLECVVVSGDLSPEDRLEDQLVENALRYDNLPVEQARSYRRLMDARGYTHRELAERLSIDHTSVTRALALLNLPAPIQAAIDTGEIRPQTGYELSRVEDPEEQAALAEEARAGRLRRDDLRERVARSKPAKGAKGRVGAAKAKTAPLPKERVIRASTGLKLTITARKPFDLLTLLASVEEAASLLRGELVAEQGGDGAAETDGMPGPH